MNSLFKDKTLKQPNTKETPSLWDKNQEKNFFIEQLKQRTIDKLFYDLGKQKYVAYYPRGHKGKKKTLQSRNAPIGNYTEQWVVNLLDGIAKDINYYCVKNVICDELGLTEDSPADVAICKTNSNIQSPQNIKLLVEVKMSIVWNWQLKIKNKNEYEIVCIGDYTTHVGNPGLLRSDTMLKAIGKSINIRISCIPAAKIPIIIIGNTPITDSYKSTVDNLKKVGIIQGFWSVNPNPLYNDSTRNLKHTPQNGFLRFDNFSELHEAILDLLKEEKEFFSSWQTKEELGKIIEKASLESTYKSKAQIFLELIRNSL